jgi:hypothetical protein
MVMPQTVEVGTKLRKKDAPEFVLEVIELFTPKGEQPHARARISVARHKSDVRLYSISALSDPRLFTPVGEGN